MPRGWPEPFRQGRFDSLCGVYAILNAVRLVYPQLEDAAAEDLFRHLVDSLEDHDVAWSAVRDGMGPAELRRMLTAAREFSENVLELPIGFASCRRLSDKTLASLWQCLAATLDGRKAAIVGLAGRERHWTVATHVTPRTIWLADSTGIGILPRSRCSVGTSLGRYQLSAAEILIVGRADEVGRKVRSSASRQRSATP